MINNPTPTPAPSGEYSFTDPANAGMRRKIDLPLGRPLNP